MKDAKENIQLKSRLQELHEANVREKAELESQMSTVIHSQAGELAAQKQKLSALQMALQQELALSQNKIAEQEKEISWLKRSFFPVIITNIPQSSRRNIASSFAACRAN